MIKFLYKKLLKPILFSLDPELVHNGFVKVGELSSFIPPAKYLVELAYKYKTGNTSKIVDGIEYKSPVLLSAGFDYNGRLTNILDALSFGGEEVGSVTARPTVGNPKPRLTRAIKSQSIVVFKGLKNEGVEAIIKRLKKRGKANDFVMGISIARTNDEKACDTNEGVTDFIYSYKRLNEENIGDYYTFNVSCPNAFGGESFAKKATLEVLLKAINEVRTSKPVYVKLPINLEEKEFTELLNLVVKYKLQGVIIGNLNKNYDDLDFRAEAPEKYRGGLSGKPCRELSNKWIKLTRKLYPNLTIIGVGGILSAEDAIEKFNLGADLVQLITGMIFEGPHLMKSINEELSKTKPIQPTKR